jgi:hypothetical protein
MPDRRSRVFSLVFLAGLLCAGGASAGEAFGPGEQSTYQVQYLGMTAGTAKITVGAPMQQWGKPVMPIVAVAKSDLALYPIKDRFISYWDAAEKKTIGSEFYVDENHKRRRQRIRFSAPDNSSAQVMKQKEGEGPSEDTHAVQAGSVDIAAASFALRSQPFNTGDTYEIPIFTGTKQFVLKLKVEDRMKINTPLGQREVIRTKAKTDFSGKLASKKDITVYFTADEAHVPVRVEAEFLLGTVVAELTDYKAGGQLAVNSPVR